MGIENYNETAYKVGYWEKLERIKRATYRQDVCKRRANIDATEGCGGSWIDKSDPWTARQVSAVAWRGVSHRRVEI